MNKLTILTVLKPSGDTLTEQLQLNALKSWQALPDTEIIVLGDSQGTAEFCKIHNLKRVKKVRQHEDGLEYLNDVFIKGTKAASSDVVMYVNSDIVLPPNTVEIATAIDAVRFLGIGQRWNHPTPPPIDTTNPNWWQNYEREARRLGTHHPPTGIDYYIFPKNGLPTLPDVTIGRYYVDNATLGAFKREGIPLIDCTPVLFAVHQNHPPTYSGSDDASMFNKSKLWNDTVYTIEHADYKVSFL